MPRTKLTPDLRAELKELAARMINQDGATSGEIVDAWNEKRPKKFQLTSRAVLYYTLKMRRELLAKADDHVAAVTERVVDRLSDLALSDVRSVVSWEGDEIHVRDSSDLTESEAAQLSVVVKGAGDARVVEISVDPTVKVRAGRELLVFLHGRRLTVTESSSIIARLTESGDREGLQRIADGEDPVKVLIDRAPFLKAPPVGDEADDA